MGKYVIAKNVLFFVVSLFTLFVQARISIDHSKTKELFSTEMATNNWCQWRTISDAQVLNLKTQIADAIANLGIPYFQRLSIDPKSLKVNVPDCKGSDQQISQLAVWNDFFQLTLSAGRPDVANGKTLVSISKLAAKPAIETVTEILKEMNEKGSFNLSLFSEQIISIRAPQKTILEKGGIALTNLTGQTAKRTDTFSIYVGQDIILFSNPLLIQLNQ